MSLNKLFKKLLIGGTGNGVHNNGRPNLSAVDLFSNVPFQNELQFLFDNLELKIGHLRQKTITVSSSTLGEGSSTLAAYYGLQLARGHIHPATTNNGVLRDSSRDVLLIDANFRHPSLHSLFNIENSTGFAELLQKKADLKDCIFYLDDINLNIMTTGQSMNHSIKEFNSEIVKDVIKQIRENFSYVIIDSAPILSNPDTLVLTQLTDGLILIVRAETTKREVIRKAISKTGEAHINILGVVLNRREYHIPKIIYDNI
mgnify:CR=1 FL=1